jgi:hypothetical protein
MKKASLLALTIGLLILGSCQPACWACDDLLGEKQRAWQSFRDNHGCKVTMKLAPNHGWTTGGNMVTTHGQRCWSCNDAMTYCRDDGEEDLPYAHSQGQ